MHNAVRLKSSTSTSPSTLASTNEALYIVQPRMGLLHMNCQYIETETNLKGNKEIKGGATTRNGGTPVYVAMLTTIRARRLMRTSSIVRSTLAFSSPHHIVFHASLYRIRVATYTAL
jgi:hypothetical protein